MKILANGMQNSSRLTLDHVTRLKTVLDQCGISVTEDMQEAFNIAVRKAANEKRRLINQAERRGRIR